ncbi:MAG: hypothetical protein KatS3mg057_0867 [Herpetosiphonaceae bacterium]|nr:MAG: hypothetical protein KatS3mg057_0867 [Herpetosiphonaceae bacterium]
MKKIAYLLNWDSHWGRGILNKVASHVRIWRNVGYDVKVFMLARYDGPEEAPDRLVTDIPLVVQPCRNVADRFIQYRILVRQVTVWDPDLVYLRYEGCYPALISLARQLPLFLEFNTDDLQEYRLGPAYRFWYNRLTRGFLLSNAKAFVFVSHEIANKPYFTCFNKPSIVVSNGIDLSLCTPLPAPQNSNPHLLFIGSKGQPWHGIDKILTLARSFPTWTFDIIGINTLDMPIPPNAQLHGHLNRSQYERLFARSDIAIGTLALHRNKMQEASPLKVREYLAYGIPTIIGYNDTDFPQPVPYILQLPNTPDNITSHIQTIQQFVEQMKGKRVPREEIGHLDMREKECVRLKFFQKILEHN